MEGKFKTECSIKRLLSKKICGLDHQWRFVVEWTV
jgi:hypothetical protein